MRVLNELRTYGGLALTCIDLPRVYAVIQMGLVLIQVNPSLRVAQHFGCTNSHDG